MFWRSASDERMAYVTPTDDEVRKNIQERRILNEHRRRTEIYFKNNQLKRIEIENFNALKKEATSSLDYDHFRSLPLDIMGNSDPELFIGDDSDADDTSVDCQLVEKALEKSRRCSSHLSRDGDVESCQEIRPYTKKLPPNIGGV